MTLFSKSPSSRNNLVLHIISTALLLFYPFIIYFGLKYGGIELIAPIIVVLFIIRLSLLHIELKQLLWIIRLGLILGILLALASWLLKASHLLLYYPVIVNLSLLVVFSYTLYRPPSLIERLARLTEPDLPHQAVSYTFRVTQVWCLFFMLNGSIAFITCMMSDLVYWTLYNGLISYLLIGLLMAGEWLVRQIMRRANNEQ